MKRREFVASAALGSLGWFEEGTTDAGPKELSTLQCLGFLRGEPRAALRRGGAAPPPPRTCGSLPHAARGPKRVITD
jgi:hypothetical protein